MLAKSLKITLKVILLNFLLGYCCPLFAQIHWAPIGAEWDYHSYLNMYPTKIRWDHYEVEKDTMVLGKACRKINYTKTFHDGGTLSYPIFTYAQNDSIYFYGPNYDDFVLTYDFSAEVGDTLFLEHWGQGYDPILLQLETELSIPIAGDTSLIQVAQSGLTIFTCEIYTDVIKHIGSLGGLLPYYCTPIVAQEIIELRCYRDGNIEYSLTDDCDFYGMISSTENIETNEFTIYPNPVSDYLAISTNMAFSRLSVVSLFGQTMWSTTITQKTTINLDVQDWPMGHYLIVGETDQSVKKYERIVVAR